MPIAMDACAGPYYIASHVLMCRFTSASRSFLKRAQSRAVLYYYALRRWSKRAERRRWSGARASALNCARAVKHFDWRYGLADQLLCGSRFYKPAINFSARGLLKLNYERKKTRRVFIFYCQKIISCGNDLPTQSLISQKLQRMFSLSSQLGVRWKV